MVEIFENASEQFGISTFNNTLTRFFERQDLPTTINYKTLPINDNGIYIYSSRNEFQQSIYEKKGTHIFVVHGLENQNFLPPVGVEFDSIWCFSEKAKRYLKAKKKCKNVKKVPQLIEDKFWNCDANNSWNILIIDPRNSGFYVQRVHEAVKDMKYIGVRSICKMWGREDLRDEIENSSVVIAYGRTAMESILCGRPTILYGMNGLDGLVDRNNLDIMMATNMSGYSSIEGKLNLTEEIEKAFDTKPSYSRKLREDLRELVGSSLLDKSMFL